MWIQIRDSSLFRKVWVGDEGTNSPTTTKAVEKEKRFNRLGKYFLLNLAYPLIRISVNLDCSGV